MFFANDFHKSRVRVPPQAQGLFNPSELVAGIRKIGLRDENFVLQISRRKRRCGS